MSLIVSIADRKLSRNFRLYELLESGTAIRLGMDNTPTPEHLASLEFGVLNVAQPLRDLVGRIDVSGGYVTEDVNNAIRAEQKRRDGVASRSKTSQHVEAEALDLIPARVDRWYLWAVVVELTRRGELPIDQAIVYEHKPHVHVSWIDPSRPGEPRGDLRLARPGGRYPVWSPWL